MFNAAMLEQAFTPRYSIIKSIQQIEITIGTSSNSATGAISPVDVTKSIVIYNGWRSSAAVQNPSQDYPRITLTNSTTVTAQTATTNATYTRIVCCTVVEFQPNVVKSVQTGSITSTATSATATISAVNVANSSVLFTGFNYTDTAIVNYSRCMSRISLTNSTTVTFNRQITTLSITINYTVIEFVPGIMKSVQQLLVSIGSTSSSASATLPIPVVVKNCMCVYNGFAMNSGISGNESLTFSETHLVDSVTMTATRVGSATMAPNVGSTVLEFRLGIIKSRNSGQTSITNGNSNTNVTIPAVDVSKSVIVWLGQKYSADITAEDSCYGTAKLSSSTNVLLERVGTANILTLSWEVIEFY